MRKGVGIPAEFKLQKGRGRSEAGRGFAGQGKKNYGETAREGNRMGTGLRLQKVDASRMPNTGIAVILERTSTLRLPAPCESKYRVYMPEYLTPIPLRFSSDR